MEYLLTLIEFLKPVWNLLRPDDLDVAVDATVMELHEDAVATGFDEFDDLREALSDWAKGQLPILVDRLVTGERVTADDVSESITSAVLDRFADSRGEAAAQAFVLALKKRLYSSKDALFILGQQVDGGRAENAAGFEVLERTFSAGLEDVHRAITDLSTSGADAADGGPSASDPNRVRVDARLDVARQFLIDGKAHTALEQLDRIASEEAAHLWTRAQFRISLNSAVALMQIGDLPLAEERLNRAAGLYPNDPILRSNLIQLRLAQEEFSEAVAIAEEEMVSGPRKDVRAAVMYALASADRGAEAVAIAPDSDSIDRSELLALASAYLRMGDPAQAIIAADRAVAMKPGDAATLQASGVARLAEARRRTHTEAAVDGGGVKDLLEEARAKLRQAEALATKGELPGLLADIRANLGAAELAAGQFESAVTMCDLVLAARPENDIARLNRGAALFRLHKYEAAVNDLQVVLRAQPEATIIPLVVSLTELGRYHEAVSALQDVWDEEIDEELRLELADLALQMPESEDYASFMQDVEKYLSDKKQESPEAVIAFARRAARADNAPEARSLLDSIDYESVVKSGAGGPLTAMDAAIIYYRLANYAAAARVAALVKDDPRLADAAELHVLSLHRSQQYAEAYRAASAYRAAHGIRPTVAQVEANLLVQLGDMSSAAVIYSEMYRNDADVRWALNSASCFVASGDEESARRVMDDVDLFKATLPADGLMQAAGIMLHLGLPGALEIAYTAARTAPNDADVQSAYAGVFLQRSQADQHAFDVSEVAPGTAVLVSIDDKRNWRLIVDCDEAAVRPLDIDPEDELGRALLGHKSGDIVVVGAGESSVIVRVEDIQSKYVRLFQDVLAEFGTRFPTNRSIRAITVTENDISELHSELGRQHQAMVQAMSMVNDKGVPAAAFSRLTGVGIFESTHALLSDSRVVSRISDPSLLPGDDVGPGDILVFDISALVTLQGLGLLDTLAEAGAKCAVTTQTVDELRAAKQRLEERMKTDTLAGDGQHIFLTTADEHQGLQSVIQVLDDIIQFVERHCESGTSTALLAHATEDDILRMMLGASGLASALYANDLGGVAVSDEAGMRVLAGTELGTRTSDSFGLIRMLVAAEAMTEEAARENISRLLDTGYTALPLSPEEVLALVRSRHMNPDAATVKVVRGALAKAVLTPQQAATLGADILSIVCFDEALGLAGRNLVDAVVEGLRERGGSALVDCLAMTKRKLVLGPLQWRRLSDYVRTWFAARGFEPPRF